LSKFINGEVDVLPMIAFLREVDGQETVGVLP